MSRPGTDLTSDTIYAPATPAGVSALAVVRIAGPRALEAASKSFSQSLVDKPRLAITGKLINQDGEAVDIAVAVYYPQDRSPIGQDLVEMTIHGGAAASRALMDSLNKAGCRLARPGEFTRRAMLYGKMDLIQAESVLAAVHAVDETGLKMAFSAASGELSSLIAKMADSLLSVRSLIEASIEFPDDEDIAGVKPSDIAPELSVVRDVLERLVNTADSAISALSGRRVAIAGPPNVGKSSLYNSLLGRNRAIVTSEAGTTRDALETLAVLAGSVVVLVDTAGIREAQSDAEKEGINRAKSEISNADLVLWLTEASDQVTIPPIKFSKAPIISIATKADLCGPKRPDPDGRIFTSSLSGEGIVDLIGAISETLTALPVCDEDETRLISLRQKEMCMQALIAVKESVQILESEKPIELAALELSTAADCLQEIIGLQSANDVLNRIFDRFCIGK